MCISGVDSWGAHVQSTVGVLVGKTLTSSSTSPYTAAGARAGAPAALDVFSVQVDLSPTTLRPLSSGGPCTAGQTAA